VFYAGWPPGKTAAYLRMLGFDTLYRNDYEDEKLAEISAGENRILLTRDRGLLKRKMVTHGFCLLTKDPRQQLLEVIKRFDLQSCFKPFSRCIACNGILRKVEKADILDQLEPAHAGISMIFHAVIPAGKFIGKVHIMTVC
jgi:uncharacterized protein with PIN domain